MWKKLRPQLPSRFLFGLIGMAICLLIAGTLELLFAAVDMQGMLTAQSARSLLFTPGAVRRSTRDRLRSGDIQITLRWHNRNDLDLSCRDPYGEEISWRHPRANSGGELDFDMNADVRVLSADAVENIHWPLYSSPQGHYRVYVEFYNQHGGPDPTHYEGRLLVNGRVQNFSGESSLGDGKQLVAEFDVRHAPYIFGIHPGILFSALIVGGWFGLGAGLLALALIGAENVWYRRHYQKPILVRSVVLRRTGIAFAVAFLYAALGQLIFGAVASPLRLESGNNAFFISILRLLAWTFCFLVIGAQLSRLVPNVSRKAAPVLGLIAGWIGGVVFLVEAKSENELGARLIGAALFGFLIGFLICLLWEEVPAPVKPKPMPPTTLPAMRLQPYRMTFHQIEELGRKPEPKAPEKPPLVPHEKPA